MGNIIGFDWIHWTDKHRNKQLPIS